MVRNSSRVACTLPVTANRGPLKIALVGDAESAHGNTADSDIVVAVIHTFRV